MSLNIPTTIDIIPATLLQPCVLPRFTGASWSDLYKYTVTLQNNLYDCIVIHRTLVNFIKDKQHGKE